MTEFTLKVGEQYLVGKRLYTIKTGPDEQGFNVVVESNGKYQIHSVDTLQTMIEATIVRISAVAKKTGLSYEAVQQLMVEGYITSDGLYLGLY